MLLYMQQSMYVQWNIQKRVSVVSLCACIIFFYLENIISCFSLPLRADTIHWVLLKKPSWCREHDSWWPRRYRQRGNCWANIIPSRRPEKRGRCRGQRSEGRCTLEGLSLHLRLCHSDRETLLWYDCRNFDNTNHFTIVLSIANARHLCWQFATHLINCLLLYSCHWQKMQVRPMVHCTLSLSLFSQLHPQSQKMTLTKVSWVSSRGNWYQWVLHYPPVMWQSCDL